MPDPSQTIPIESRPLRFLLVGVLLVLGSILLGCRSEVVRGEPREGGEILPGWNHASHYDWGWLDLSGREPEDQPLGPPAADIALGEGWGEREIWGRWAMPPASEVELVVEVEGHYDVCLEARTSGKQKTIALRLDGREVGSLVPERDWQVSRSEVSAPLTVGVHHLTLVSHETTKDVFLPVGERGLAVRRIGLLPTGRCFEDRDEEETPASHPVETLVLNRTATWLVPLRVPDGPSEVTLVSRARVTDRGSAESMALQVEALTMDGERSLLTSVRPTGPRSTVDHLTLDLGGYSGRSLVLLFSARLPSNGSSFALSDARLHTVEPTTVLPPQPTPVRPPDLPPPNVLATVRALAARNFHDGEPTPGQYWHLRRSLVLGG